MRSLVLSLALLFLGFAVAAPASACPGCKEGQYSEAADAEDGEKEEAATGDPYSYNWSVIFMLSMPFLLAGGFATAFWHTSRRR